MSSSIPSPANLPAAISEVVAQAAMTLPPLTRPQDTAFLEEMSGIVLEAFMQNYVRSLPQEKQDAFDEAAKDETGAAIVDWMEAHANFAEDASADALGKQVLQEIADKLPAIMQQEYENFREEDI